MNQDRGLQAMQQEMYKDKKAYLQFVDLVGKHMSQAIGASKGAELHIPIKEVMAIPEIDVKRFFDVLVAHEVLKEIRDNKGAYYSHTKVGLEFHVHCIMNSTQIFEYMRSLPGYGLFYGKKERNFWGENIAITSVRTADQLPLVILDDTHGVYFSTNPDKRYPVASKRKKMIWQLHGKEKGTSLKTLMRNYASPSHTNGNKTVTMNNIAGLNKVFRETVGADSDLISNRKTAGGYVLNTLNFRFERKRK